jgi:hypothetical protein
MQSVLTFRDSELEGAMLIHKGIHGAAAWASSEPQDDWVIIRAALRLH